MERFDWQNIPDLDAFRSHTCKHFLHPTEADKRICIQSGGLLHAFTGEKFEDIDNELPSFKFPEGKELTKKANRHFIMDLPSWGETKLEDGIVRVYDKKGVSIFRYQNPLVVEKGKQAFRTEKLGVIDVQTRTEDAEDVQFEIENNKLYLKMPSTLKAKYPLQAYDATDTASTNSKDTMISHQYPTSNAGTLDYMIAGMDAAGYKIRVIIHFILSSGSGTISLVKLFLCIESDAVSDNSNYEVHELTQTGWVEAQVTWNIYKTGSNWVTAGGDYSATVIDVTAAPNVNNWQNWVLMGTGSDNPLTLNWGDNVHLLIKRATESGSTLRAEYCTKEEATAGYRPYIEITYTAGWANITKINGIASASISKIDEIAVASISKVNGIAV